ncbi:helix-turn-helix domain-containing protein [Edaphobacter modestus]|uniref:Excisionase family DNA binding protein n=1 Tax=Edaphobacter modestus TaxID=388466 RepID=A0A4Q7YQZ4_9BACT|nr:excisionase family DNA binding protein [Edaphobacter modestus]
MTISKEELTVSRLTTWPRLLTPNELADLLSLSVKTLYSRAKAGTIPVVRIGSSIRFDPKKISLWIEEHAA